MQAELSYRDTVALEAMKILISKKFDEATRTEQHLDKKAYSDIADGAFVIADEMEKRRESR